MAAVSCSYIVARVSENQKGQSEISADANQTIVENAGNYSKIISKNQGVNIK